MQSPSLTTSADTLVKEYGLYHQTRLTADPDLDEMRRLWDEAQNRLANLIASHDQARSQEMVAMAVRDGAAASLGGAVRAFYCTILGKTHNNRKSPPFGAYFPEGLAGVVGAPLEVQAKRVSAIVTKLTQEQDADLRAHAAVLISARDTLLKALDAHRTASCGEVEALGLLDVEKRAWFDLYQRDYRTLTRVFYQDLKRADSYFKPPRRSRAKAAPAVPPAVHLAPPQEASA
jgi:hypothetical protein